MTDQNQTQSFRLFKIGAARVVETEAMSTLTNEQGRDVLKTSYPEVANATIREREEGDLHVVEFLPQRAL